MDIIQINELLNESNDLKRDCDLIMIEVIRLNILLESKLNRIKEILTALEKA